MKEKRYGVYTPQINSESAFLLRRLAWATKKPMTVTLDSCISSLAGQWDKRLVCSSCKDKRCQSCRFRQEDSRQLSLFI